MADAETAVDEESPDTVEAVFESNVRLENVQRRRAFVDGVDAIRREVAKDQVVQPNVNDAGQR